MSSSSNNHSTATLEQFDPVSESVNRGDEGILIKAQLALEGKLQEVCQQLIRYYKESHDWPAVSQLAQNLITNAHRINRLKSQLRSGQEGPVERGLGSITESQSEDESRDEDGDKSGVVFQTATAPRGGGSHSELTNGIGDSMEDLAKARGKEMVISVTRAGSDDTNSSEVCYRVEACTLESELDGHVPPEDRFVLHYLEDFQDLRKSLVSKGEVPELCVTNCESRNAQAAQSDCHNLSKFLNGIVRDPILRSEPELLDFLSRGQAAGCSKASGEQPTQNGDTSQEVPAGSSPALNGHCHGNPGSGQAQQQSESDPIRPGAISPGASSSDGLESGDMIFRIGEWGFGDLGSVGEEPPLPNGDSAAERSESGAEKSDLTESYDSFLHISANDRDASEELPRSESNPVLGMSPTENGDQSMHLSLLPTDYPARSASSDDLFESGDTFSKVRVKRQSSVPSVVSRLIKTTRPRVKQWSMKRTRKASEHQLSQSVALLKSIPTVEWDPTCLLEELYSDCRRTVPQDDSTGEFARHYGYLEKLPLNQSKATVLKGFKRRYFRAKEGNIYYYEYRTSEKALGFIRLTNSKIICNSEKLQIQILEKNGKSMVIKAPDTTELNDWLRALQLEAAHPTMPTPLSPTQLSQRENRVLIVDIGACSVRAGFAMREDPFPEVFFPAACSIDTASMQLIDCGLNALMPQNRFGATIIYPRKPSVRMDKTDQFNLRLHSIRSIMYSILHALSVDPYDCQLIMTLPPTTTAQNRNELAELLLEGVGFSAIYFQEQALLALYSYNTTSGVVVNIGDQTEIVPIVDGYKIEAGVTRIPFGGSSITEYLSKLITDKGIRYFSETESYINRFLKEQLCYVSKNFKEDSAKCEQSRASFTHAVDVDRFQLPDHRKVIALDDALFKAPEGLFDPQRLGKDISGIHEMVWNGIQACPIDHRKELSKSIFLAGASTQFPHLKERLQKELSALAPLSCPVEVHANPLRQHAAFMGASVLAQLSSFRDLLVTREEWDALGVDALSKWNSL